MASAGVLQYETPPQPEKQSADGLYHCGTLRYTAFGLFMLFVWLLWGDFIWTLMDTTVPTILPLKLTMMHASDTANQVLNRGLSSLITVVFAPVVSMASDRHRGPWGRRIPFLFWSTPLVGLCLILIGCYDNLTNLVMGHGAAVTLLGHFTVTRASVTLFVFGAVFVGFDFASIFVNTVYWYLFNDVVPPQFLSRYMSCFRIVGNGATIAYNYFLLGHALDHFKLIFVIAGISYVVGFMLMCIFVREGEYPPPKPVPVHQPGFIIRFFGLIRMFARECFTHPLYWYFFLYNAFTLLSMMLLGMTQNRDVLSLGLTLGQLGTINAWTWTITLLLQYPAGWLSDKIHPIRVFMVHRFTATGGMILQLIWLFKDFGPRGNLMFYWAVSLAFLPFTVLAGAAEIPMYMRLLPKDRYGQYCSANAMLRSFVAIFGSYASGQFLDYLTRHESLKYWHYRIVPAWSLLFNIPALLFIVLMYREWKKRGGDHGYTPP